jgi:hypothetical protein
MVSSALATAAASSVSLRKIAAYRGIRVLAWDGDVLYGGRGYELVRWQAPSNKARRAADRQWKPAARFDPAWWRNLTARSRLSSRLVRDGFHALAVVHGPVVPGPVVHGHVVRGSEERQNKDNATLIAAVPGAIVTRESGRDEFHVTHRLRRGTRPLHITAVPSGTVYWGEYFDNRERAEVHIYASDDRGENWQVAHTFAAGAIRHVHNIVFDPWGDCLWILTGDAGAECKVLRTSCDLRSIEVVLSGNQQARAVAAIPTPNAVYLATDTPLEANHVLRLSRSGKVETIADLASSSIFGCRAGEAIFFSTMAEPSAVNSTSAVQIIGSADQENWQTLARWRKDAWPMRYFQYGNAFLPDGNNATNLLAGTTVAVEGEDLVTTIWEIQ